ncbi:LCP family protein [Egicoccus sp. AB-alg6-2]|uniref:LCP family protein n=1 Tax=Egicoccus sp. AB-alg6-2 TaxID=3242692 RepID=UPI00359EC919
MTGRGLHRLFVAALVAGLLFGGSAVALDRYALPAGDGEVLTLLLLGSDEGPPRSADPFRGRADGFQILFVSGDRQHATFVSVPRDAWVPVAGRGNGRINNCLLGGGERCMATVENEFGIEVDGYLVTSMDAFKAAVNAFGGLTVDVATPVSQGGASITSAGVQQLTGSQALTYGRDRKTRAGGDLTRSRAQAELLAVGHRQLVAEASPDRVLDVVSILRRHTVTDLSGPQLARLGFEALQLPPDNVQRVVAEGDNAFVGEAAVVRLRASAYQVIRDAADDARVG